MKKDVVIKRFLSDNERYADIINGFGCFGKQQIRAEDLQEADPWEINAPADEQSKNNEKMRDIIRKVAFGVNFAIIGLENQETVDYSAPFRVMFYDVSRYETQVKNIKNAVRKSNQKLRDGEFLYGFKKDSRLAPVVTFVLYYGKEEYDGATDLHGIIDFSDIPEEIRNLVQNYKINVIDIRRCEDLSILKTDVRTVFEMIRDSNDMEKWRDLVQKNPELESDAYDMVAEYTSAKQLKMIKHKYIEGGTVDMCKALDDLIEKGRAEGKNEGREEARLELREELRAEVSREVQCSTKAESLRLVLAKKGELSETLKEQISTQTDPAVMDEWFHLALDSASVQEFEERIS